MAEVAGETRARVVQAFTEMASAARTGGDVALTEQFEWLAEDLGHHGTEESTLTGLLVAMTNATAGATA